MAAQDVILSVRLSAQVGTKTLFSLKSDGAVDWYQGLTGFGTERGKGNRQNVFHYQATINAEEFVSSIEEELNGFVALEGTAFTIPSDKTCGAIETITISYKNYNKKFLLQNSGRGEPPPPYQKLRNKLVSFDFAGKVEI